MTGLPAERGTYVLVLHCPKKQIVSVGRLGSLGLLPGYYLYVGSAFGSGGLRARCGHHLKISTRPRWHIDYLRAVCDMQAIWFSCDPQHREHEWADSVAEMRGLSAPFARFGASDCDCNTHLFFTQKLPSFAAFKRHVYSRYPGHHQLKIFDSL